MKPTNPFARTRRVCFLEFGCSSAWSRVVTLLQLQVTSSSREEERKRRAAGGRQLAGNRTLVVADRRRDVVDVDLLADASVVVVVAPCGWEMDVKVEACIAAVSTMGAFVLLLGDRRVVPGRRIYGFAGLARVASYSCMGFDKVVSSDMVLASCVAAAFKYLQYAFTDMSAADGTTAFHLALVRAETDYAVDSAVCASLGSVACFGGGSDAVAAGMAAVQRLVRLLRVHREALRDKLLVALAAGGESGPEAAEFDACEELLSRLELVRTCGVWLESGVEYMLATATLSVADASALAAAAAADRPGPSFAALAKAATTLGLMLDEHKVYAFVQASLPLHTRRLHAGVAAWLRSSPTLLAAAEAGPPEGLSPFTLGLEIAVALFQGLYVMPRPEALWLLAYALAQGPSSAEPDSWLTIWAAALHVSGLAGFGSGGYFDDGAVWSWQLQVPGPCLVTRRPFAAQVHPLFGFRLLVEADEVCAAAAAASADDAPSVKVAIKAGTSLVEFLNAF